MLFSSFSSRLLLQWLLPLPNFISDARATKYPQGQQKFHHGIKLKPPLVQVVIAALCDPRLSSQKPGPFARRQKTSRMEVDSDANSRFAEGTRNFVNWFRALPGATFHSDLIAVDDLRGRNAGRGIGERTLKKISGL